MRISGIAYVNSRGTIQVHRNTIEGLTIFNGALLSGIYYPRSKDDPAHINKSEFMFSPIPYEHWKCSSRLIIKLKKQSEAIPKLTEFLKEKQISILQSVSNRSAHRYSTWDIHISFDKLVNEKLQYENKKTYYKETKKETDKLASQIKRKFKDDILFSDKNDIDLKNPITKRINTALHYFHDITEGQIRKRKGVDHNTIYAPFTVRYADGNLITNSGRQISTILSLTGKEPSNRFVPTIAFIESDSHYLNYRLRIIKRDKLLDFYKVSIYYNRVGSQANTTRGLLDLIINNFSSDTKIWMSNNQLYECRENYGCGRINFFVERPANKEIYPTREMILNDLESSITVLNKKGKPKELSHVNFWSKALPIYPNYIRKHFKNHRKSLEEEMTDVFICFSSEEKDKKKAEYVAKCLSDIGLSVFMSGLELKPGDRFNEKIRKGLNSSRELCLLYSPRSAKSEYITTEWGAAWFMEKNIVTMYFDMKKEEVLSKDERLASYQIMKYNRNKIPDFCNDVLQRKLNYYIDNDDYEYYQ